MQHGNSPFYWLNDRTSSFHIRGKSPADKSPKVSRPNSNPIKSNYSKSHLFLSLATITQNMYLCIVIPTTLYVLNPFSNLEKTHDVRSFSQKKNWTIDHQNSPRGIFFPVPPWPSFGRGLVDRVWIDRDGAAWDWPSAWCWRGGCPGTPGWVVGQVGDIYYGYTSDIF